MSMSLNPFYLPIKKELRLLFDQTLEMDPIRVAVVCPETPESLVPALQAKDAGIICPLLIGDVSKMEAIADKRGWSLDKIECIDCNESEAILKAIQLAQQHQVDAVQKGSVSTHALISAIVHKENGLRTDKRITHIMLMDIPAYKKPLIITDGAFNVAPTLADKKQIIQNSIDFAKILNIPEPKVAVLSAISTVSEKIPSSVEAELLAEMARKGEITGGVVEGPLSFDIAICEKAAAVKDITSEVAGQPDILVVPGIEVGNILFKSLNHLAGATGFGIGVGGKVPIILTSRSATLEARIGSCLLAKYYLYHKN